MDFARIEDDTLRILKNFDWMLPEDQIIPSMEKLITEARSQYDQIVSLDNFAKNFDNVVQRMDKISYELLKQSSISTFPAYMSPNTEVRKSANSARQIFSKFNIETGMRKDLYDAVKQAADNPGKELNWTEQRLLERFLRNFRRNGLDLSEEIQIELKEINEQISDRAIKFSQVLNEVNDTLVCNAEQLEGIPKSVIGKYNKNEDDNFVIGMSYPEIIPVLEYAKSPETRSLASSVYGNRGVKQGNVQLLEETIALKDKKAKILGYDHHADFMLEVKMAENSTRVWEFLNDLISKLKPQGLQDLEEIGNLKFELENSRTIFYQDWLYYSRLLRETKYGIDNEIIKEYFPMAKALNDMMNFYQELLGLSFHLIDKAQVWHEDVSVYAVTEKNSNDLVGIFYLDLYPREGKFSHAAVWGLSRSRTNEEGQREVPIAAMLCNFDKPTPNSPSLLKHSEIRTLYHEFGHIMHQMCTKTRFFTFSGTSVSRDFVEAPSQMLENWIWEPSVLNKITKHYQTGDVMPSDLIDKLVATRYVLSGLTYLRQLFFGTYDMTIHTKDNVDTGKLWSELAENISLIPAHEDTNPAASFGHLMSGYDAGYYGYMWSQVISRDLYTRFEKDGIESKETGLDYRKSILEQGNEKDESELIIQFLGREFNNEAFLRALGI